MKEKEIIEYYENSYKEQFDEFFKSFNDMYVKAIDKKYATKIQLQMINLVSGFIIVTELDRKIIDQYDHILKLGGNVEDVVNTIPNIVNLHKQNQELKKERVKNDVSVVWKKFFGIPYKIEKINATIKGEISSSFEHLTNKIEIAEQLGRQRAVIDLRNQIKTKFIENNGLKELTESEKNLPIEFKTLANLKESLSKNDLVEFFKILQSLFASLSYDMKITEGYFHSHIHLVLTLLDFEIHSEIETNQGRIDSVIETENYIHIIEFKQNDSDVALEQILSKKYYQKYLLKDKTLILVGVAVDKNERNIISWKMKSQ
jgi:hypothetical protein